MSYWDNTLQYFWREESLLLLAMMLALAFLLFRHLREARKSVLNTLIFFFICVLLQFLSGLIHAFGMTFAAALLYQTALIGAGIALIRLSGLLLFRIVLPKIHLSPPRIAEDIFVIIVYGIWGLVQLRYVGLDLGGILATSAMITAVLAFSMQDTLGNILGGLALQLDNSIEIDDWIKVDDVVGRVVDIRWRSTLVETRNWETVVFPNSQLMKNKFMVLGRRSDERPQVRRWIWFGVSLNDTPARVIGAVEGAIRQAEIVNVAKVPQPSCVLMEIDKGYARYALRYWLIDLANDDSTDGAVRWHVYTALERVGIRTAVEEHKVHIIKENEKYEETMHQRELQLRVRTLREVELFAQMTGEELHKLAEGLKYAPFAKGNIIFRQGAVAHWLYVIISGEVEAVLELPNGERRSVNVLSAGSVFGETGMMTGAPRSATAIARTDVECYRLGKEAFEEIILARPGIAEEVAHILAERRMKLDSVLRNVDAASMHAEMHQRQNEVLKTIKRFFGL